MFAVCAAWHWKPGLAYWALQKRTSKSLSGIKCEFLWSIRSWQFAQPRTKPHVLLSHSGVVIYIQARETACSRALHHVWHMRIGPSSVELREAHSIGSANCSVGLLVQTGSFFCCRVVLGETWFQGGEQAEALGTSCPDRRASVKQGQVQDKPILQTTLSRYKKK